jgi:Lrp/AsnC family transcriptional regulator, leucine-responsive regulatory protein
MVTTAPIALDQFVLDLLEIVRRDNQMPHLEISNAINLSVPSVARRLARLRASGVIAADKSVLKLESVGACDWLVASACAQKRGRLKAALKSSGRVCGRNLRVAKPGVDVIA